MKKCTNCGNEVEDAIKICSNCGHQFSDVETNETDFTDENTELQNQNYLQMQGEEKSNKAVITNNKPKLSLINIICIIICVISFGLFINTNTKLNNEIKTNKKLVSKNEELNSDNVKLSAEISILESDIEDLNADKEELANGAKKQLSDINNAYENGEWQEVIDLASDLHDQYNGSDEDSKAQILAKKSQKKIDKQKAKEEAKKAKGYETGITYDQLARNPDKYETEKVKFSGRVVQVLEGDDSVQIRLAVNDDYDQMLFGEYSKSIVSSRILEDDHITIYGMSLGTISYDSTMGGK